MKANTEQLACWRRSDSRARRSDGRGELHCTPGKRGVGEDEGRMRERGNFPFFYSPSIFFFIVNSFSRALLSERLERATQQH